MREHWGEGHRYQAVRVWCCLMERMTKLNAGGIDVPAMTEAEIREGAQSIAEKGCRPPLPRADWEAAFKNRKALNHVRNQTLADWLNINEHEASCLDADEACSSWPVACAQATGLVPVKLVPSTRAEQREMRRAWLTATFSGCPPPDLLTLSQQLESDLGLTATKATLAKDLRAVGIWNPRGRKPQRQSHLPF
jgi:hypothetical protein